MERSLQMRNSLTMNLCKELSLDHEQNIPATPPHRSHTFVGQLEENLQLSKDHENLQQEEANKPQQQEIIVTEGQ